MFAEYLERVYRFYGEGNFLIFFVNSLRLILNQLNKILERGFIVQSFVITYAHLSD